ncbi:hypothetical protein QOL99_15375 [Deinococcus sp. MIMF12]|uniref:Lipoprotein n=1 Tax=Deinococcus rhizophilus TaxID=3049544 RepID=A0ABT7JKD0_9DEIO|nr:hypothetical protein [Deinococcus rhizophilus]MDL2345519.1 hypothetical protein [Deinococcus rhizophilus]
MKMKRASALLGLSLLLAGCGQQVQTPPAVLRAQTAVPSGPTLQLSLAAQREQVRDTRTTYAWTLTKRAVPDGRDDTAAFEVTADLTTTVGAPELRSTRTTVSSGAAPLQLCNTGGTAIPVAALSLQVVGLDAGGAALADSIDVSGLFGALPLSVPASGCLSAALLLTSDDAALTAGQRAMLNAAASFRLAYAVTAGGSLSGTHGPVSPALSVTDTASSTGDRSVTLSDPEFGSSETVSADTTRTFARTFSCADRAGLEPVPGSTTGYTFANTAFLKGASTDLHSSAADTVTLRCAVSGCTYTQGYYKTHAEYFQGKLNRKYDPAAWAGARNWVGSETQLRIGNRDYTQQAITRLYDTPPAGNPAVALFHQLATARLNLLKSAPALPHPDTSAAIGAADAWFAAHPGWASGTFGTRPASDWTGLLDAFNNGGDSLHCD